MNEYIELIDKWERERRDEPTVSDGCNHNCGVSRLIKMQDDTVYQRIMNKERLLEKRVYMCHRGKKRTRARKSQQGRRSVESKKDIACRYEMWCVRFASEPSKKYFVTMHGHTGHDPAANYQEMRWLRSNDQIIESICSSLFDCMTPAQILDHLQRDVLPGDFSNPFSSLTLPHIRAFQKKYWRRTRISEKDGDAVHQMIQAPNFPLLSYSKKNLQHASQGGFSEHGPSEKFHIAICSPCQSSMLKKFGDLVFLDTVHGMTKYGYYNMTILVLDEYGHGFPVAFMLSEQETSKEWTFLIQSAFKKAGRDPSKTTFMIDKSSALIAAIKKLGGNYLLCIFHMMQEIDRRLNHHTSGLGANEKKALKYRIHRDITTLRRIEDDRMFRVRSEAFKRNLLANPKGMSNAEGFVAYYQKNWEACADQWAACGRTEFKHLRQNTNNLIESFFNQLRQRFCRKKKTRLDEHLEVLVRKVIPQYLTRRANIEAGIERSKNEELNAITEFKVSQMVETGYFKLVDPSIGQGYVQYQKNGENFSEWFCMAELSCTCRNYSGACIHIEATSRYLNSQNRALKYQTLLNHAQLLRKKSLAKFVEPSLHVSLSGSAITHEADALHEYMGKRTETFFIDAERAICSCGMFLSIQICAHVLAVLHEAPVDLCNVGIDAEAAIPAKIFQQPRLCSNRKTDVDEDMTSLAKEECTKFQMLPHAKFQMDYEKVSISQCVKLMQMCRRIPEENQKRTCDLLQELESQLQEFLPPQLMETFTQETITEEKKQGLSRYSTDRTYKPLYPRKKQKHR